MKIVTMAGRNLLRNRRRTIITACSVAFGVLLSVTFTGTGDYSYTNMIDTSATMGLGNMTIEAPGYNDTPSLDRTIQNSHSIRDRVTAHPEVKKALIRIMGQAMFASGAKSTGGMFMGIDPEMEEEEYNIFLKSIIEGEVFADRNERGIVIGSEMAEKLRLKLGRKLVVTATDRHGEMVSTVGRVSGIFKTGDDTADSSVMLIPIDHMRQTLNYGEHEASFVSIFIKDQRQADEVRNVFRGYHWNQDLEILTWKETQAEMAGLIAIDRVSNYLLQFLVGLIIAAGIMNTLLMSVMERKREFGIMMAVGMSPWQVVFLVMVESCLIGIFGLLLGVIITTPWFLYLHQTGIDLANLIGEDYSAAGIVIDPVLKIRLFRESVVAIVSGIFFLTILAGLFPAVKAGRVQPVESIKQV